MIGAVPVLLIALVAACVGKTHGYEHLFQYCPNVLFNVPALLRSSF